MFSVSFIIVATMFWVPRQIRDVKSIGNGVQTQKNPCSIFNIFRYTLCCVLFQAMTLLFSLVPFQWVSDYTVAEVREYSRLFNHRCPEDPEEVREWADPREKGADPRERELILGRGG